MEQSRTIHFHLGPDKSIQIKCTIRENTLTCDEIYQRLLETATARHYEGAPSQKTLLEFVNATENCTLGLIDDKGRIVSESLNVPAPLSSSSETIHVSWLKQIRVYPYGGGIKHGPQNKTQITSFKTHSQIDFQRIVQFLQKNNSYSLWVNENVPLTEDIFYDTTINEINIFTLPYSCSYKDINVAMVAQRINFDISVPTNQQITQDATVSNYLNGKNHNDLSLLEKLELTAILRQNGLDARIEKFDNVLNTLSAAMRTNLQTEVAACTSALNRISRSYKPSSTGEFSEAARRLIVNEMVMTLATFLDIKWSVEAAVDKTEGNIGWGKLDFILDNTAQSPAVEALMTAVQTAGTQGVQEGIQDLSIRTHHHWY